jgi:Na(+)-translocating NADH:ubiquinone oxidoreductase C subunit
MVFPFVSFTQSIQQELETITNPYKTNSKNTLLQELLNEDELALQSQLNSYAFVEGKSHQLKGDINLTNSKVIVRKDSPNILPYWKVNGSEKIILIMSGNGLWDRIGGYILVNENSKIIENIVFSHKNETPGLGAEISKRSFEEKFIGLKLDQTPYY